MIRLENLSKTYYVADKAIPALTDINLKVEQGKISGVIGQSGAGKSTLIRCVNLLERPTQGRVWVDKQELTGLNAAQLRAVRRKIGMIFQHFNLLSAYTAYENIALPLRLAKIPPAEIESRISRLLELTGLSDRRNSYPRQLSGGQKQRVAIARALASQPQVLLCDEATSSLDPSTTRSILSLLRDINKELGLTVLLITHEMDVIKRLCDRVVVMSEGKIIEQGDIGNIFTNPQHALTRALVHDAFHEELPDSWLSRVQPEAGFGLHPMLRLIFAEDSAAQPLIAEVAQTFGVKINILEAHMEMIHDHLVGTMIVTLQNDEPEILQKIVGFFGQHKIIVEVLGYVANAT
ncbi:MAG: methionine ABC transporter ATP-binding protein [Gammaproteobacteria bacterium]